MMKKLAAAAIAAGMALALTACGDKTEAPKAAAPAAAEPVVGVVQLVEHPALDLANKGIVDALKERGVTVKLDQQNAQGDQSNLRNIVQRFISEKVSLIFAIATPAAQTAANATSDIPIVATAVTDFKIAKLIKDEKAPGTNVTGVSDMNPVAAQLDLFLKLVPNTKNLGVMYNSSEINSQYQVDILKKAADERHVTLTTVTVSNVNDIQQAAQSLVGKVDGIYVPTDNVMASAMPALAKVTTPAKIPVMAADIGMTKGGEGIGTYGIDYYELGKICGNMGADVLQGKGKPATMPIRYQEKFKAIVNTRVMANLGLTIPEDVKKTAELYQ